MQTRLGFGQIKQIVWPVASYELKKFVPMLLMIFCIASNYNTLKIVKDSTLVPIIGAEVIPFVKVWVMLPMAILVTALFTYLVKKYNESKAFYLTVSFFLTYFCLFVFLIYPNRQFFDFDSLAHYMSQMSPNAKGFAMMVRKWHLCLFYVMCEIWGTMVLFVLFWGFANRTITVNQAKRFYPLLGLAGNSTGIFVPIFFNWASTKRFFHESLFKTSWEQTLGTVTLGVLLSGLLSMLLYYYLNKPSNSTEHSHPNITPIKTKMSRKKKESFFASLKIIAKMPYVRSLTLIVISYNVIINLTEVLWKDQIRQLYPDSIEYGIYFGKVMFVTGVLATISDFIICSNVIRKFGWTFAAMITPVIMAVTSVGFFGFLMASDFIEPFFVKAFGVTPLFLTAFFGSMQNALARSAKYSLFDSTKEMAFIPLEPQCRIQSKAAIDGVCSRLGKSGGSLFYQILLLGVAGITSLADCIPFVALLVGILLYVWCHSVKNLGSKFHELTASAHKTDDANLKVLEDKPAKELSPKQTIASWLSEKKLAER